MESPEDCPLLSTLVVAKFIFVVPPTAIIQHATEY
jgi:hypothetical protein